MSMYIDITCKLIFKFGPIVIILLGVYTQVSLFLIEGIV